MTVEYDMPRADLDFEPYDPEFTEPLEELIERAQAIPRGEPGTYGATPLDNLITLKQQQELLIDLLRHTYDIPMGVSLELASYVHETFSNRFRNRGEANNENYISSLLTRANYEDNFEVQDIISRAETGHASPAELLLVQKLLGIRSVELACLTHPYGERIRKSDQQIGPDGETLPTLLDEMRDVVDESIIKMGGELSAVTEPSYRAKEVILNDVPIEKWAEVYALTNAERLAAADKYGGVCGILMTRKRERGVMPDGTIIKERSSFVLRIDEGSLVSEEDINAMLTVPHGPEWQDAIVKAGRLDETARILMEMDAFDIAIPLASTIYAHNLDTAEKVMKRFKGGANPVHQMRQAAAMAITAENMPVSRDIQDYNGMLLVGYKAIDD